MCFVFREKPEDRDVEAVRTLVAGTGFFRSDEIEVATELVEERLAKGEDSGYHFLFADADDHLAGYVCYGPIPCTIGSFDLYWIAVDRERQGRGLGLRLAQETERAIRLMGGRSIYVETSGKEQYRSTRLFYERAGYRQAALLPDFYDVGDPKIIYQKQIF